MKEWKHVIFSINIFVLSLSIGLIKASDWKELFFRDRCERISVNIKQQDWSIPIETHFLALYYAVDPRNESSELFW